MPPNRQRQPGLEWVYISISPPLPPFSLFLSLSLLLARSSTTTLCLSLTHPCLRSCLDFLLVFIFISLPCLSVCLSVSLFSYFYLCICLCLCLSVSICTMYLLKNCTFVSVWFSYCCCCCCCCCCCSCSCSNSRLSNWTEAVPCVSAEFGFRTEDTRISGQIQMLPLVSQTFYPSPFKVQYCNFLQFPFPFFCTTQFIPRKHDGLKRWILQSQALEEPWRMPYSSHGAQPKPTN